MCFAPLDFRFCPKFLSGASCWFLQISKTSLGLVCASAKLVSLLSICLLMCVVHEWMRGMMCQHLQIRVFIVYPHWSQMCRSLLTGLRLLDDCNILGPLTSRRLLFSTLFVHDTCATNSSLQVLHSIGFHQHHLQSYRDTGFSGTFLQFQCFSEVFWTRALSSS